jgi:hypothetical protein
MYFYKLQVMKYRVHYCLSLLSLLSFMFILAACDQEKEADMTEGPTEGISERASGHYNFAYLGRGYSSGQTNKVAALTETDREVEYISPFTGEDTATVVPVLSIVIAEFQDIESPNGPRRQFSGTISSYAGPGIYYVMNPSQQEAGGVMAVSYSNTFNPNASEHEYVFSKQYDASEPTLSYIEVLEHNSKTFKMQFRMAVQTGGMMEGSLTIEQP